MSITVDYSQISNISSGNISADAISNTISSQSFIETCAAPYTRSTIEVNSAGTMSIVENLRIVPTLIKTIGRKTFVEWSDGTKTKVTCEHTRTPDPFSAFCAAFAKRVFGSTSKVLEAIENADEKVLKQREREANRAKNEERRQKEKEQFEKDVAKKRYEMAVQRRAEALLNEKE